MTVPLTGTNGLFTRLGAIEAGLEGLNNFLGNCAPPPAVITPTTGTGTLGAGTYYVRNTYISIAGESLGSFETSVVLSATGEITVDSPPPRQGATGWNCYISSSVGTETRQGGGGISIGTNYTQSATLSAGSALPTVNTFYLGLKSIGPLADYLSSEFSTPDQNLVNGLYAARDAYRSVHTSWQNYLVSLAQATLIQMVNNDTPLAVKDVPHAMQVLISQMGAANQSVQKPYSGATGATAIAATATAQSTNTGGGILLASPIGQNGLQLDYVFNETIQAICTTDGQSNSGTAGQETFSLYSPIAETNEAQWDWPLGSGLNGSSTNAVDATVNGVAGQLLQNGAFGKWTNASVGPDNWLIQTGTVGTQIVQATGAGVYKGSSGLSFVGDGSTLTSLAQNFNATPSTAGNSGGTSLVLYPLTVYALNLALKVSSVPGAGVLQIALTDQNNNIVTNYQGVQQKLTFNLTGATTSFVLHNIFFQTPAQNPSTGYRLQISLTTPLSSGVTLYLGHVGFTPAIQPYKGGPFVALFSGYPNFILQDTFNLTVANNYNSRWQLALERLFGMRNLALQKPSIQVPSSTSPTIADSLIG